MFVRDLVGEAVEILGGVKALRKAARQLGPSAHNLLYKQLKRADPNPDATIWFALLRAAKLTLDGHEHLKAYVDAIDERREALDLKYVDVIKRSWGHLTHTTLSVTLNHRSTPRIALILDIAQCVEMSPHIRPKPT